MAADPVKELRCKKWSLAAFACLALCATGAYNLWFQVPLRLQTRDAPDPVDLHASLTMADITNRLVTLPEHWADFPEGLAEVSEWRFIPREFQENADVLRELHPVFPADALPDADTGAFPEIQPGQTLWLVRTHRFPRWFDVPREAVRQQGFTGLVLNGVDGLDREEYSRIQASFPSVDFDHIIVIGDDRNALSWPLYFLLWAGTLAFLGLSVPVILHRLRIGRD